eukprot:gene7138-biopygen7108
MHVPVRPLPALQCTTMTLSGWRAWNCSADTQNRWRIERSHALWSSMRTRCTLWSNTAASYARSAQRLYTLYPSGCCVLRYSATVFAEFL